MIKKCLFPAAGYGTRFLPATKAIPKEMLPIVNKPLLQYGVEEAISAGCRVMAVVTGRGKRAIEDHFDVSYELEHQIKGTSKENYLAEIRQIIESVDFTYTRQKEMRGLGDAILTGEKLIGNNESFAVVLADDLCDNGEKKTVLYQMAEIYKRFPDKSIIAIEEVPKNETYKYGIISGELMEKNLIKVDNMIEKPEPENAPSNFAIVGRYILNPQIFDVLRNTEPDKRGEIQITDALLTLAKKGKVLAYRFSGKRFDCGSVKGFIEATNYFYEKRL